MPSDLSNALPLRRELFAVSLDPLTGRDAVRGFLKVGTLIEGATEALKRAEESGLEVVTVRSRCPRGWVGVERVGVSALRNALR